MKTGGFADARTCIFTILGLWLSSLLALFIMQFCHLGIGLTVWPLGEDHGWIVMLQNSHGPQLAKAFWIQNDRNPLSPWLYNAVAPIILGNQYGMYFVRKLIDPVLAITAFFLIDSLGRQKQRCFALSCAVIILFWNSFVAYAGQIMWPFLVALSFTLLSISLYKEFVDHNREKALYLALSQLFYFAAFATYTLQCGAVIAVFFIALIHDKVATPLAQRLKTALADSFVYGAFLGLYLLIWSTTARAGSTIYSLDFGLFRKHFFHSLLQSFWQGTYTDVCRNLLTEWSTGVISAAAVILGLLFYVLFDRIWRNEFSRTDTLNMNSFSAKIYFDFAAMVFAVLVAVSLPTIMVESTTMGFSRICMVGQFISPCLFGLLVLLVSWWISRRSLPLSRQFLVLSFSLLGCLSVLMGLEYNKQQCAQTRFEQRLADGLRRYLLPAPNKVDRYFLVRLDHCDWLTSPILYDVFMQSRFNTKNLHLRILPSEMTRFDFLQPTWVIEMTEAGVKNATFGTGKAVIPWDQVVVVSFDGEQVRAINPVRSVDVKGLQVNFKAETEIKIPMPTGSGP